MSAVLHLLPSVGTGGTEAVAETLDALARAHAWESSLHARLAHEGHAPWHAWARWALGAPRTAAILHAHLPWPDRIGPALAAARKRPLVVTFHLLPTGDVWPRDRLTGLDARTMVGLLARRARTRTVALSRHDAARLRQLGLDPAVIRNAPPAPRRAQDPIARVEGLVTLASVGRLDPQKGFDRALSALARLPPQGWRWLIAGDGPAHESLVSQRDRYGLGDRVSFLGRRPAAEVFAAADLLFAPSRSEGMPLVPLEAIEAGVPVLASAIAPHLELFEGVAGSLLPDNDAVWGDVLRDLVVDAPGRHALAVAQRAVLGDDPRAALWQAYASLYRAAAETP